MPGRWQLSRDTKDPFPNYTHPFSPRVPLPYAPSSPHHLTFLVCFSQVASLKGFQFLAQPLCSRPLPRAEGWRGAVPSASPAPWEGGRPRVTSFLCQVLDSLELPGQNHRPLISQNRFQKGAPW